MSNEFRRLTRNLKPSALQLTNNEHKMILEDARKQLIARRTELIEELRKLIRISDSVSKDTEIYILLPSGKKLGSIKIQQTVGDRLDFHSLWIGQENYDLTQPHSLRRLGIGELLLEEAIKYAKERNIRHVELDCKPEVYSFYEKFRFRIRKIISRQHGGEFYLLYLDL